LKHRIERTDLSRINARLRCSVSPLDGEMPEVRLSGDREASAPSMEDVRSIEV